MNDFRYHKTLFVRVYYLSVSGSDKAVNLSQQSRPNELFESEIAEKILDFI